MPAPFLGRPALLDEYGTKYWKVVVVSSLGAAMFDEMEEPRAIVCNEIRGGNRKFVGARKLPGMVAWVATFPIK